MAYTTPQLRTTGEIVNSASWNSEIRDNFEFFRGNSGSILVNDTAQFGKNASTSAIQFTVIHSGACNTGHAQYVATVNGANAGDPSIAFRVLGVQFWSVGLDNSDNDIFKIGPSASVGTSTALAIDTGGKVYINDTANAKMTLGLTINQGAADDEALALKSADVSHAMTDVAEADTYLTQMKYSATSGGGLVTGLSSGTVGLLLRGNYTTGTTTKSTAGVAGLILDVGKRSGTGIGAAAANENLVSISDGTSIRFIFDADGDLHADAALSASAYDAYDDAQLGRALQAAVRPAATIQREALRYGREDLERAGVATFNDGPGGDGSVFVSYTKLAWLSIGAHWQSYERQQQLERRIEQLTRAVMVLGGSALLLSEGGNT